MPRLQGQLFDIPERPLGDLRIPLDKAIQITAMLVEGVGVRASARLANVHGDTVLAVLELVGARCAKLMDERVQNAPFQFVQADELFCFVHCKEAQNYEHHRHIGTQYVFLGIDAQSKFTINFTRGKRDSVTCQEFMMDLRKRVKVPFQQDITIQDCSLGGVLSAMPSQTAGSSKQPC